MASQPTMHRRGGSLDASRTNEDQARHKEDSARSQAGQLPPATRGVTHLDGDVDYVHRNAVVGHSAKLPPHYFRSTQFLGVVAAECLSNASGNMSWVLPLALLGDIENDLGPSDQIYLVPMLWAIGASVGSLLLSRLSDICGRRWILLCSSALGSIGGVLAGAASNLPVLVVASAIIGIASAGQLSSAIVLGELVPNKQRGPISAVTFAASLPFVAFGSVIARSLSTSSTAGWRWGYYGGLIINLVALPLYYFFYYPPSFAQLHVGESLRSKLKSLDWAGMALFIAGWTLFLVGLLRGGAYYTWDSAAVLCPLVIGVAMVIAFGIYETFFCKSLPIVPLRLLGNVSYISLVAVSTIATMILQATSVILPIALNIFYAHTPDQVSWLGCVIGGGLSLGILLSSMAMSYVPKVKLQVVLASVLNLAFLGALVTVSASRFAHTVAFALISCITLGYASHLTFVGSTLVCEAQDIGLVVGFLGFVKAIGASISLVMYLTIFANNIESYSKLYIDNVASAAELSNATAETLITKIAGGERNGVAGIDDKVFHAALDGFSRAAEMALRHIFYALIPASVCLLLVSFFVPDFAPHLNNLVARKLQTRQDRDTEKQEQPPQSDVELQRMQR